MLNISKPNGPTPKKSEPHNSSPEDPKEASPTATAPADSIPVDSFRVSLATCGADGKISTSLSLSKEEVKSLGNCTEDSKVGSIPLNSFWKRIGKNNFCLPDGGLLNSETKLSEYYAAARGHYSSELAALTILEQQPTFTICYKERVTVPNDNKTGDEKLDLTLHELETNDEGFGQLPEAKSIDPNSIAQASNASASSRPGTMTTGNWNEVLVNNSLLNGHYVDADLSTLHRARKTAFRLQPNPVNPFKFSPGTVTAESINDLRLRAAPSRAVLNPVRRLQDALNPAQLGVETSSTNRTSQGSNKAASVGVSGAEDKSPTEETEGGNVSAHLYPLWEICDDSSVSIENTQSTFQHSSAAQGFSSKSIETAISTSALGFSGSASAGYSAQSSSASSDESGSSGQQMHASYEFPRVRLYLDRESISLSEDCKASIQKIQDSRSHDDLLGFYKDYGTIYVTQLQLGGRLHASRIVTAEEAKEMSKTQNAWKASVAASFSSITTSGSVKADTQEANANEQHSQSSNLDDRIAWEAQGGDTTLANNPGAWCTTVANFWSWRTVKQEVVLPLEHVISALDGYEYVRKLFLDVVLQSQPSAGGSEIRWSPIPGNVIGSGVNQVTRVLMPSAFDVGTWTSQPTTTQKLRWTTIGNKFELRRYLSDQLEEIVNRHYGTKLEPKHASRLVVSDRAFSVVLRCCERFRRSTAPMTWKSNLPNNAVNFQNTYGTRFIDSMVFGCDTTVVCAFAPELPYIGQYALKEQVMDFFADPNVDVDAGCSLLSSLARTLPCETYVYDAYFNETRLETPSDIPAALTAHTTSTQVLTVDLRPYTDRWLQKGAPAVTSVTVPYQISDIQYIRKCFVESAVATLQQSDRTISEKKNDGNIAGPRVSKAYDTIFQFLLDASLRNILPSLISATRIWDARDRALRWLRMSRRHEFQTRLDNPIAVSGRLYGIPTEPDPPKDEPKLLRRRGLELFNMRELIPQLDGGLPDLSDFLMSDWGRVETLLTQKGPFAATDGYILAYETKNVWDGKSTQPKWFLPDVDLLCGAKLMEVRGNNGALQNLWGMWNWDFKDEEILDTENIPWR